MSEENSIPSSDGQTDGDARRGMSIPEIGGLSLIIAILVAGAFFFSGFFKSSSTGDGQAPSGETSVTPALPAKGKLLTLNSAEPYWRKRRPGDRGTNEHGILPEVVLEVAPVGTGFLKVLFLDESGAIAGDVNTLKVADGKFTDTRSGEAPTYSQRTIVSGSRGLKGEANLLAYRFDTNFRWTIEILEGADYSKGPWERLAYFQLPGSILDTAGKP